jgi:hypothetical protein
MMVVAVIALLPLLPLLPWAHLLMPRKKRRKRKTDKKRQKGKIIVKGPQEKGKQDSSSMSIKKRPCWQSSCISIMRISCKYTF